jgi:S1-C subfamily serine protease
MPSPDTEVPMRLIGLAVVSFLALTACTSTPPSNSGPRPPEYRVQKSPTTVRSESCEMGQYWRSDVGRCAPIRDSGPPIVGACPSGAYWDSALKDCRSLTPGAPSKPNPFAGTPPATTTPPVTTRPPVTMPPPAVAPPAVTRRAGTAFAVRSDGLLLTAFHVVGGARSISVRCGDKPSTPAALVETAATLDLAVVRAEQRPSGYLPLAAPRSGRVGDHVFTIGLPAPDLLGPAPKYTDGAISALSGLQGEAVLMQTTVPIQPGNSGGPIVNEQGEVVGIVVSTAAIETFVARTGTLPQNINWAVKAEYALPLFEAPPPRAKAVGRRQAIENALARPV